MLKEIDRDFFCSSDEYKNGKCNIHCGMKCFGYGKCSYCHRKYPTLKQFREEYGFEWKGAVYWAVVHNDGLEWVADDCRNVELMENPSADFVVCACTPFVPSNDWRPE